MAVFGQKGLGLRINLSETTTQSRGGKGIQFYKDKVAGVTLVNDSDNILIGGNKSSVCISAKDMPRLSRGALGNILIKDNVIHSGRLPQAGRLLYLILKQKLKSIECVLGGCRIMVF